MIVLEHVTKRIHKNIVLRDIDMTFQEGIVYGLRGYNGSGKTMLLRIISGLIRPTNGRICIDGQILGKDMDFPSSMGVLIENPAFLDDFSGKENLEMIMSINKVIDENRLMGCLNEVGLTQSKDLKYKKYSLGMKQRLGIAAAFMEKPKLILLDEPTNALDEEGIQMLEKLINEMRDNNRIIIIASHEKDFLNKIADIVYLMDKGSICLEDN
ncbi:MAG: ATP-binding cassette domain-containing protein [Coprococcus catus]